MSKHWVEMRVRQFGGNPVKVEDILAHVAANCPEDLAFYQGIDWKQLRLSLATIAIEQIAKEHRLTLAHTYNNVTSYETGDSKPPNGGKCIGVLSNGKVSLGFSVDKHNALSVYFNGFSAEQGSSTLKKWEDLVDRRMSELQAEAIVSFVAQNVQTVREDDVTTVIGTLRQKEGV